MPKILIVEDDQTISKLIAASLSISGYESVPCFDGNEAVHMVRNEEFDLILLDIMLPGLDGFQVMEKIRETGTPVIFLTAMGDVSDRVKGLKSGAEDYIVKPFSPREVVARIKAVLRRVNESAAEDTTRVLRFDGLTINLANYEVKINDKQVPFTPKEVEILYLLASHPGQVFDREQILSRVWGYDYFGDTRAVDTQIKRIRQKFPEDAKGFGIRTIYGVGYKFEVEQ